jgi:hypothetical protein
VEEYTAPGRRTNADALPRLGAGYFSGVTPSAGLKTKPYLNRSLPVDLDSQPSSLKLPSRLNLKPCPNRAG